MNNFSDKVSFIWSVADLLRGDYKQSEYGRVILPFLVLRRPGPGARAHAQGGPRRGQEARRGQDARGAARADAAQGVWGDVLQHARARLRRAHRRPGQRGGEPARLRPRLLQERQRHHGEVPLRAAGCPARRREPALPRPAEVRRGGPRSVSAPGGREGGPGRRRQARPERLQHGDGLHFRGADPEVLGAVERDGR